MFSRYFFFLTALIAVSASKNVNEGHYKNNGNEEGRNNIDEDFVKPNTSCLLHHISKRDHVDTNGDQSFCYFNWTNRANIDKMDEKKKGNSFLDKLTKHQFTYIYKVPMRLEDVKKYAKIENIQTENIATSLNKTLLNNDISENLRQKNKTNNTTKTIEIPKTNNEQSRKSNITVTNNELNQTKNQANNLKPRLDFKSDDEQYRKKNKLKPKPDGKKKSEGKNVVSVSGKEEQLVTTEATIEIHIMDSVMISKSEQDNVTTQSISMAVGEIDTNSELGYGEPTSLDGLVDIENSSLPNFSSKINNLSADETSESEMGADSKLSSSVGDNAVNITKVDDQELKNPPVKENRKIRSLYPNPIDFQQFHLMHGLYPTNRALLEEALRKAELQASLVASNFQKSARLRQLHQQMDSKLQPEQFETNSPEEHYLGEDEFENNRRQTKRTSTHFDYPQNQCDEKLKQRIQFLKNLNSAIMKKREELSLLDQKIINEASIKPSENCAEFNSDMNFLNDANNINKINGLNAPQLNEDNFIKNSFSNSTGFKPLNNISQINTFTNNPVLESALKTYFSSYYPVTDELNTRPQLKDSLRHDFIDSVKEPVIFQTKINSLSSNLSRKFNIDDLTNKDCNNQIVNGCYANFYSPSKIRQKRWIFHRPVGKEVEKNIVEEKLSSTKIEMIKPDYSKMFSSIEDDLNRLRKVMTNYNQSSNDDEEKHFYVQVNVSLALSNDTASPVSSHDNKIYKIGELTDAFSGGSIPLNSSNSTNSTESPIQDSTESLSNCTLSSEVMQVICRSETTQQHNKQNRSGKKTQATTKPRESRGNRKKLFGLVNDKQSSSNKNSKTDDINAVKSFKDEPDLEIVKDLGNCRKRRKVSIPGILSNIHISGRIINTDNFTEEGSPLDNKISNKLCGTTVLHPSKNCLENRLKNASIRKITDTLSDTKPALYIKNIRSAPNMVSRLNSLTRADVKNCTIILNQKYNPDSRVMNERKIQIKDDPPHNPPSYNLLNELVSMNPSIFEIIKGSLDAKKRNSQSISNFEIKIHE